MLKKKKEITFWISWAAVILWMSLVFYLSSQAAEQSSKLSVFVTEAIIGIAARFVPGELESGTTPNMLLQCEHIVRKLAHGGAYFVLGVLVMNALRRKGVTVCRAVVFSLMICVLYAVSDEIHQLFVSGRSAQVTDVLIDSVGAASGLGIYGAISKLAMKK